MTITIETSDEDAKRIELACKRMDRSVESILVGYLSDVVRGQEIQAAREAACCGIEPLACVFKYDPQDVEAKAEGRL